MSQTLQQRIYKRVKDALSYAGAWMVWCDPRDDWGPLLRLTATAEGLKGFSLISVTEETAGQIGSPLRRRQIQERIDAQQSFVLHVVAAPDNLGWLWAQALLAEETYKKPLREQLREWGWRPQNIHTGDDELAKLARLYFHKDPVEWGGGGLQPDPTMLLNILAGAPITERDDRMILDLTLDAAGLPALDETHLDRWRTTALARLLITQAQRVAPALFQTHEALLPTEKQKFALDLLAKWADSVRLSKGYGFTLERHTKSIERVQLNKSLAERILEADRLLIPASYMRQATIETTAQEDFFLSQAAERALFAQTCATLAEKSGRDLLESFAPLHHALLVHARGFWGDMPEIQTVANEKDSYLRSHVIPWGELARLSKAVDLLLKAEPREVWNKPDDALQWYVRTGWQVEQAGEEIMRHLSQSTAELITLITPLRNAYYSCWEETLIQWSDLWTKAGCLPPHLRSQGEWLQEQLKGKQSSAVLVVDALRYDIGMALKDAINAHEGVERAHISPARTALPSITALGMGMALPLNESDLQADIVNGKWQLSTREGSLNLSIAENRREWLRTQLKVQPDALLTVDDIEAGKVPEPNNKRNRLFIFDNLIDKLGHDEELEPLGTRAAQQRYLSTIEHLREKKWQYILIVTDHGFIHWSGPSERRVPPPLPDPAYTSRRALAYSSDVTLEGPQGLVPGGKWRIAVASGASCFRTYGGLGFFHGGASLQEWIVPCIKIEWPRKATLVDLIVQPISQILSQRPKIILEVKREKLFGGEETLARQVEVRIREDRQNTIIFRSAPKMITPADELVSITMELVEGIEAERNTPLTIEVYDARTDEPITTATTTLMVAIENW
jgi:hypothetical protein